jgi:hypothetical protein
MFFLILVYLLLFIKMLSRYLFTDISFINDDIYLSVLGRGPDGETPSVSAIQAPERVYKSAPYTSGRLKIDF